jgi:branched-chain amino acid transport system substrate-binding protein
MDKKKKLLIGLVSVGVVLILMAIAIGGGYAQPAPAKPIKIGFIADYTGYLNVFHKDFINGLEMRLEEAGWKVAGRPIKLITEDGATDPIVSVDKTKKLIDKDNIDVFIAPVGSPQDAVWSYLRENGIKIYSMTVAGRTPIEVASGFGPNVRAVFPGGALDEYTDCCGVYAYNSMGARTASILFSEYVMCNFFATDITKSFTELGGKILQTLYVPIGTADYGPYLAKLKKADCLFFWTESGAGTANFVKQYKDFGFKMPIVMPMATALSPSPDLVEFGDVLLGLRGLQPYGWHTGYPPSEKFLEDYKSRYGILPGAFAAGAYINASVILAALEATGGDTDPKKLYEATLRLEMETPQGALYFTSDLGFGIHSEFMCEVQKIGDEYVWTPLKEYPEVSYTGAKRLGK